MQLQENFPFYFSTDKNLPFVEYAGKIFSLSLRCVSPHCVGSEKGQKGKVSEKLFCAGCGSWFQLRRFSKPCAAIELAKLFRWARLPQPSGCVKQGLGKALPNKIPMGQNEQNAKSGTSVESCSLLL